MKFTYKNLSSAESDSNAVKKWAVFQGAQYFVNTVTDSEKSARIAALEMSAQWYREQADKAHRELESLGAVNDLDPYGYLA